MKQGARLAGLLDALHRRLREVEQLAQSRHLPRGVTLGDLRVLRAVEHVGMHGVSAVAAHLGTSQPAATVAIARLEKRGFLVRGTNAFDARRQSLTLTAAGKKIEQAHLEADAEAAELVLSSIPKAERQTFVDLVARFVAGEGD